MSGFSRFISGYRAGVQQQRNLHAPDAQVSARTAFLVITAVVVLVAASAYFEYWPLLGASAIVGLTGTVIGIVRARSPKVRR
jgi:hypothetical protein